MNAPTHTVPTTSQCARGYARTAAGRRGSVNSWRRLTNLLQRMLTHRSKTKIIYIKFVSPMDERKLRYFLAVVDESGVTRAAERLRIAQPSLSQALRSFESELGAELFHRVGRGLQLSAAGEQLVGPARQVIRAMDEARGAVSGVSELRAGTLELATLPTLSVDPMAPLIGRFRERYPGVEVHVHEPDNADGMISLIADGACELGAAHLPLSRVGLCAEPLGEQELLFILPPGSGPEGPL